MNEKKHCFPQRTMQKCQNVTRRRCTCKTIIIEEIQKPKSNPSFLMGRYVLRVLVLSCLFLVLVFWSNLGFANRNQFRFLERLALFRVCICHISLEECLPCCVDSIQLLENSGVSESVQMRSQLLLSDSPPQVAFWWQKLAASQL